MPQSNLKKNFIKIASLYNEEAVFTAFDTETTGLHCKKDKIIEIGAIKFNKFGIIDKFSALVNPGICLPYHCYELSGISQEMVEDKKTIEFVLPDFFDFIEDSILIAHNANFDVGFINEEATNANLKVLSKPNVPPVDTVKMSRLCFPTLEKHNLQFLAKHFNINPGNAHRAYDDALVCMSIFLECLKVI